MKKLFAALVIAIGCVTVVLTWTRRGSNPLSKYGVQIAWRYDGATSSVPGLDVWWTGSAGRVDCPPIFGGIENPKLSFADLDGDGIEEIIFEGQGRQQIASFKPSVGRRNPTFSILKQ